MGTRGTAGIPGRGVGRRGPRWRPGRRRGRPRRPGRTPRTGNRQRPRRRAECYPTCRVQRRTEGRWPAPPEEPERRESTEPRPPTPWRTPPPGAWAPGARRGGAGRPRPEQTASRTVAGSSPSRWPLPSWRPSAPWTRSPRIRPPEGRSRSCRPRSCRAQTSPTCTPGSPDPTGFPSSTPRYRPRRCRTCTCRNRPSRCRTSPPSTPIRLGRCRLPSRVWRTPSTLRNTHHHRRDGTSPASRHPAACRGCGRERGPPR